MTVERGSLVDLGFSSIASITEYAELTLLCLFWIRASYEFSFDLIGDLSFELILLMDSLLDVHCLRSNSIEELRLSRDSN